MRNLRSTEGNNCQHAERPGEKIFIGHNFTALPESDLYPDVETLTADLEDRPERYAQLDCILCCDCANGQTLKNHGPGWVRKREESHLRTGSVLCRRNPGCHTPEQ